MTSCTANLIRVAVGTGRLAVEAAGDGPQLQVP
jgi:hypothetical protein